MSAPAIRDFIAPTLTNLPSFSAYFEPVRQLWDKQYRSDRKTFKVTRVRYIDNSFLELQLYRRDRSFNFLAGQFVQIVVEHEGRYLTRCYSIASTPDEFKRTNTLRLGLRIHKDGLVSRLLASQLKPGKKIAVLDVQGEFILREGEQTRAFVAGGSGISPIIGMLESLPDTALKQSVLIFSLRNGDRLPFSEALSSLLAKGLRMIIHDTQVLGHITPTRLSKYLSESVDALYTCGPAGLISQCRSYWQDQGKRASRFHCESFGQQETQHKLMTSSPVNVTFRNSLGQKVWQPETYPNLLEFAEAQGLRPTSGCRIGVCHQCLCRKHSGHVINMKTGQKSDGGPEDIQLCQSAPLGEISLEL